MSGDVPAPTGQLSSAASVAEPYVSAAGAGRRARISLLVLAAVDVVAVLTGLGQLGLLVTLQRGEMLSDGVISASDTAYGVVGILQTVLFIVAAILFTLWFRRAYRNLPALGFKHRFRPGWAVAGWVVPIWSLFRPKQIANDIWRAGGPEGAVGEDRVPVLWQWWWGLWIVAQTLSNAAFRVSRSVGDEIPDLLGLTTLYLASDAVDVVAAVVAASVVRRSSLRQEERAGRVLGASPPAPSAAVR